MNKRGHRYHKTVCAWGSFVVELFTLRLMLDGRVRLGTQLVPYFERLIGIL
jgi:hypothetical protein